MNEVTHQFRGDILRSVQAGGLALVDQHTQQGNILLRHRSTFECSREVSVIAEAAGKGNLRDGGRGSLQQIRGSSNTNQREILAERAAQRAPETSGYMDWMNASLFRRLTQR